MKSILDPSFKYTNSVGTDLQKTFARVRREQAKADAERAATDAAAKAKTPLLRALPMQLLSKANSTV